MRSELKSSTDCRGVIRGDGGWHTQSLTPPGPACSLLIASKWVLGGHFLFESDSRDLMDLVEVAYGGLAPQVFPETSIGFRIELRLLPPGAPRYADEPPAPRIHSDADQVTAVTDASNYVVIEPGRRRARVVVSEDMLKHAYHVRYELIEFAVFILAARGLGLVPLHAACVGLHGRGLLLLGGSGVGKSTLALHCLLEGLDLLAEDAVFVHPMDLLATGVRNFLHVRPDALETVGDNRARCWIEQAPMIRRRSGVTKFEADLRRGPGHTAVEPLELAGAVFVSTQPPAVVDRLIEPLCESETHRLLSSGQPNASHQPGWACFRRRVRETGCWRLRRARHPSDAVAVLRRLLD